MGERSSQVLTFGVLALLAAAAGVGVGLMQRAPQPLPADDPAPTETSRSAEASTNLEVHVAGWVVDPGVVLVSDGSIVADAIDAAGGLRIGAMVDLINLAAPVSAGDQVVVPGPEEDAAAAGGGGGADSAGGLVSLNRATASELENLPGVGPVLAERILSHREARGGFDQVEDLLEVPGIGEAKLAAIRDLVRP